MPGPTPSFALAARLLGGLRSALARRLLGVSAEEIRYTFEDVRAELRDTRTELKAELSALRAEVEALAGRAPPAEEGAGHRDPLAKA